VLDLLQHAALVVGVLDLLHLDDLGLLQHLDGVEALVVLALHEVHAPEAAGAERALDLEVGERVLALGDARLVERLRGELHGAVLGRAGGIRRVYQVLDAGRVVRGRLRVRALRGRRGLLLLLRGVHRVGRLVLRGCGRGRGLDRVVRPRLMQVERARGTLRGRLRQRRRAVDGGRRAIEFVGALRVLRPLLLQEAESRHGRGADCGRRAAAALAVREVLAASAAARGMRSLEEQAGGAGSSNWGGRGAQGMRVREVGGLE
jgi:hypothetical protein